MGGVLGLLLGGWALHPPETDRYRRLARRGYAAALTLLAVFLVAVVLVDWPSLGTQPRIIYSALIGLAAAIVTRVFLAFRAARLRLNGWQVAYMNHIYFSYISLWEGLFIVGLIDLGAPIWMVGAVAVAVLLVGAGLFSAYRRRMTRAAVG